MNELARQALEQANGDWSEAFNLMLKWVGDDPEALDEIVRHGCWHAVQIAASQVRQQYFARDKDDEQESGEAYARTSGSRLREIARQSWYNYPLPGGQRLGSATQKDLEHAHHRYDKLSKSNGQRRDFIERVQGLLGESSKVVEEVVAEEDIENAAKGLIQ